MRVQPATWPSLEVSGASPMEEWPWVWLSLVGFISGNKKGLQKKGAKDGQPSTFLDVTPSFYLVTPAGEAPEMTAATSILHRMGPTFREVMASTRSQSSLVTEPGLAHCF